MVYAPSLTSKKRFISSDNIMSSRSKEESEGLVPVALAAAGVALDCIAVGAPPAAIYCDKSDVVSKL